MGEQHRSAGSDAIPLWLRIVLGVGSFGSGVAAYIAIMRPNTPEVGGVAFVALAGLLAVLSTVGRIPQRVNAGSMGVEFGEAEKLVEAADRLPAEGKIDLADGLVEGSIVSPAYSVASEAIRSAAQFEQMVIGILVAYGWATEPEPSRAWDHRRFDAEIVIDGKSYGVEIKAIKKRMITVDMISKIRANAALGLYDGAILIVPDGSRAQRAFSFGDVWIIEVSEIPKLPALLT